MSLVARTRHAPETALEVRDIEAMFTQQTGYATPVFRDGRILLVRETADEHRWSLPGGWADVKESPAEAVVKEMREEAGLEVRALKLAAVWDRARHAHKSIYPFYIWKLFFLCEITSGEPQCGPQSSEVAFIAEHELPADLSTRRLCFPKSNACSS